VTSSNKAARIIAFGCYWAIAFIVLHLFTLGNSFCERPGARSHLLATVQLALAIAVFDSFVSLVLAITSTRARNATGAQWGRALIAALLVGLGLAYLPFWIYEGYGVFRFEHTWADVSCFFTEAYEVAFSFIVAPALALLTFLREVLVLHLTSERSAGHNSWLRRLIGDLK
jgi:hypothetical protein